MLSPRSYCSLLVLSLGAVIPLDAAAHISLDYPKSRYYSGNQAAQNKLKNGPCGVSGDSRTTNTSLVTTFKPGQQITVKWKETIQHPGYFRIAFDNDGQDFTLPGGTSLGEGVSVLADKITDKTSADYSFDVTLPNVECSKCTLQLIQVMTTSPPPFEEGEGKDLYFNCADIVLSGSAGSGGAGSGGSNSGGRSAGGVGGVGGGASGGSSAGGMSSGGAGGSTQGQGGTNANGGSNSSGGAVSSNGGTTTAAQAGSSTTGSGGATGSGGVIGNGGVSAARGGTSSTGTPSGAQHSNDPAGCSFSVGRESGQSSTLLGLGLLGLGWRARRRRAKRPG